MATSEYLQCAFDYSNTHREEILAVRQYPLIAEEIGVGVVVCNLVSHNT